MRAGNWGSIKQVAPPRKSAFLPGLWGDHLRHPARGRPRRQLRPVPSGRLGHLGRGLSPEQAADPATGRRPVRTVDLHRDDQQAGAAVGWGVGGPLQRTGHHGPHGGGDPHADETSWRQERGKAWLWATVAGLITVFTIARNRNAQVAQAVLGTQEGSIAVTDRLGSYDWIARANRQICWSHLRRDFQAMIDRGAAAEPIGQELLRLSH